MSDAATTAQVFGIDVDGWRAGAPQVVDARAFGYPIRSLAELPAWRYRVQAMINRYQTFRRSDGHSVKLPPDSGGNSTQFVEGSLRGLMAQHRERRVAAWRALAAYVPRFYGMSADEVFASAPTDYEFRLAVARMNHAPSWEALLEQVAAPDVRETPDDWEVTPMRRAANAIRAGDLDELRRVVEAHPELVAPRDHGDPRRANLLRSALYQEARGEEVSRPIIDWLCSQSSDLQHELNVQLCGAFAMRMKSESVRSLLRGGADPNWVAPNGIPVLEHALVRYWSGDAVDVLAAHVRPRRALWIAAGLGDVNGVRRFLDAGGKPTPAARKLRPDFEVLMPGGMPQHPEPDDEEILMEAFVVAMLNGRAAVMEYMVSRGFPVDSLTYGSPIINIAVGNAMVPMVERLIRCGADLDLRGWHPNQSAREVARSMFEDMSRDADRRRIVELCGLDPEAVLAERDAQAAPPGFEPKVQEALQLAAVDAFRLAQPDVRPENCSLASCAPGACQPISSRG